MIEDVYDRLNKDLRSGVLLGVPKHVRLREAISTIIRDGLLKPGDQIPPEQTLTQAVGLSLGTVRKALSDLAVGGVLIREQGRGTFVSQPRSPIEEVWQFRFVERPGGKLLSIAVELISRRKIKVRKPGAWLPLLNDDDLCEFKRRIIVNDDFTCTSRFYVSYRRFPELMNIPIAELHLSFKALMSERFSVYTHSLDQFTEATVFDDEICHIVDAPLRTSGVAQHSLGRTVAGDIISYQYLAIPPGPYLLEAPTAQLMSAVRIPN